MDQPGQSDNVCCASAIGTPPVNTAAAAFFRGLCAAALAAGCALEAGLVLVLLLLRLWAAVRAPCCWPPLLRRAARIEGPALDAGPSLDAS